MPEETKIYPPNFPRGIHPDLDVAWDILDRLDDMWKGCLNSNQRAMLAGAITGALHNARNQ